MSAPPHDGWPAVGSRWEYWDDLLLACQLAGLRNGWTGISKRWDDRQPEKLLMRCHIGDKSGAKATCDRTLLTANPEDPRDLSGAWIVKELQVENLESKRHSSHVGRIGISDALKLPPIIEPKIKLKKTITGWNELHLIEASLKVEARVTNRFIQYYTRVSSNGSEQYTQCFGCILGEKCTFLIRFRPVKETEDNAQEPKWKCTDLCRTHSCSSYSNTPPSDLFAKCLAFWPRPRFSRSHQDTVRTKDLEREEHSTKTDDQLGPYRLLAAGETFEQVPYP